jgi:indole-3-glycerol phosphate synthase
MRTLDKQILKVKKREVQEIRRGFSDELIKAAAFSVGGEYRSLEFDVKQSETFPLIVEFRSRVFPQNTGGDAITLEKFDPLRLARVFLAAGLQGGIIVASDVAFLGGNPAWINLLKAHTHFPVLQHDFFIDPLQFYQGKALGADGFFIRAECTDAKQLAELLEAASQTGLEIYLELAELAIPENVNPALLNGVVFPLWRDAGGRIRNTALESFLKNLPQYLLKFARGCPQSPEEIAFLEGSGFQGIVLSDEFWLHDNFAETFAQINAWCSRKKPVSF